MRVFFVILLSALCAGAAPRYTSELIFPKNIASKTREVMAKDQNAEGRLGQYATKMIERADDMYFSRMGWFTRTHPVQLLSGRILVPMYSDGYSFGIMAISDDSGYT